MWSTRHDYVIESVYYVLPRGLNAWCGLPDMTTLLKCTVDLCILNLSITESWTVVTTTWGNLFPSVHTASWPQYRSYIVDWRGFLSRVACTMRHRATWLHGCNHPHHMHTYLTWPAQDKRESVRRHDSANAVHVSCDRKKKKKLHNRMAWVTSR